MEKIQKKSKLLRTGDLEGFAEKINKFGVGFTVCDVGGELVLLRKSTRFESDKKTLIDVALSILEKNYQNVRLQAQKVSVVDNRYLGIVLQS